MSLRKLIALRTGAKMPQIGLGTWLSQAKEVENAVEIAVRNGYRHLDLAMIYGNQREVGAALKKLIPSVVRREELFITSKLWNSAHQPSVADKELDETLEQLGLDYLDLYLVHWPVSFPPGNGLVPRHPSIEGEVHIDNETSIVDTWKAMIALPNSKVKAIGVSNFTKEHLNSIINATGVIPAVNQIEAHPLLPQDDLRAYCEEKGIHITAYSPLGHNLAGKAKLTEHPVAEKVAKKLGATPAQVLIAWGARRGYSVIPKSVHEDRIISNFQQIELGDDDYAEITEIGGGQYTRFNIPCNYRPKWNINIFGEREEQGATFQVKLN